MLPSEITYFTVTLFLAIAALIYWKHRRDVVAARLNRGLAGYVATGRKRPLRPAVKEESDTENLIPV